MRWLGWGVAVALCLAEQSAADEDAAVAVAEDAAFEVEAAPWRGALTGQVGFGLYGYDDGGVARVWPGVENDLAPNVLRLEVGRPFGDFAATARLEVRYHPLRSPFLDVDEGGGLEWTPRRDTVEFAEIEIGTPMAGTVFLGQGPMASDGVATEADFSGTDIVASAGHVVLTASQPLRLDGGEVSDLVLAETFPDYDNLAFAVRLRWDSPQVGGVTLRASYGRDLRLALDGEDRVDLALAWAEERDALDLAAAATIGWLGGERIVLGSLSGLHEPTGFSLSFGTGIRDGRYGYGKLGWRGEPFGFGETRVSVDRYLGRGTGSRDGRAASWGLALVQEVEAVETDLYLTVRDYRYREPDRGFRTGLLVFAGFVRAF